MTVQDAGVNEAVERVRLERQMRGSWSIRRAAEASATITNQTWSVYEKNGIVTAKVRTAVAKAFDWPLDWPDNLPAVVNSPDDVARLRDRMAELDRLVNDHARQLKALAAAVKRLQRPTRRSTADSP